MLEQGRKYDGDKLRYDLIPVLALEEMVKGLTYGTIKYDDNNWMKVPEGRKRYMAAALRHIQEYRKGVLWDEEQNIHHLSAAMNNLSFIVEKDLRGWEDDVEEDDISQEELKGYVTKFVDIETHRSGTITMGTPSYSSDGAHTNSIDFSTKLWYPPVEDGGNPWIEHTTDKAPTGINTVEWLLKSERDQERYNSGWDFVEALTWDGWDTDRIVAYRSVD